MINRMVGFCRDNKILPALLALALLLRVVYLVLYNQMPEWEQLTVDNWYHHNWAETIADGNVSGDTTYFRAPFYVYCLGLLYSVFGASLWTARLFGLTIGLTSIVMTFLLARRLLDKKHALLAAGLHAVYPITIYFESELLLDPLFTLLVQIAVYRFIIWHESRLNLDLVISGIIFGLAAITRPTILVVIPAIVIWMSIGGLRTRMTFRRALASIGLLIAGLAVCITPILVRNSVVAGDPMLISSQGGINLFIGNNDTADGLSAAMPEPLGHNWQIGRITHIAETELGQRLAPGEVSSHWRKKATDWILTHPEEFGRMMIRKLGYQFADREISNNRPLVPHFGAVPVLRYNPLSFGIIFPLAVLGSIRLWRRSDAARFILVLMAFYILTMSLFFFNSRFRLPLVPFYLMLAAGGVGLLLDLWHHRSRRFVLAMLGLIGLSWFSFAPPMSYPDRWSSQSLTSRGLFLYNRGDISGALKYFQDAIRLDPVFPEVNLNLGVCYFRLGQADSAIACFDREIDMHPGRPKAYYNLASLLLVNGHHEQAIVLADHALEIEPYDVTANNIRLRAIAADSLTSSSILAAAVEEAAEATNNDRSVLNEGAGLLLDRGDLQTAWDFLQRADAAVPPPIETDDLAFGPNFSHSRSGYARAKARTFYLLGYWHAQSGNLTDAVHNTRQAILHDTTMVEAYINLYTGYRSLGRAVEADSVLTEAARLFPQNEFILSLIRR